MRDLSNGYDIVQESRYYADVIVKTLEQVDRVIELKWDSVTRMREALQLARDFLFERLVALIRATTDDRHGIVMGEISLQALQELIDTRGLEPTEKA